MNRSRALVAFALAACTTTACGGGGGSSPTPALVASGNGADRTYGFAYDAAYVAHGHLTGRATFASLAVDLALPMRDAAGLRAYAATVGDPSSANYRHFLTPGQIADRYSATAADQTKAIAYLRKAGLAVRAWRQRLLVHAVGTRTQLEAALHTTFGNYVDAKGAAFVAPMTPPSVATGIPIVGSPNVVVRPARFVPQFVSSHGLAAGYAPQQIAAAFDFDGAYAAGYTGSGIAVGIIGTGPIVTSASGRLGDAEAYKALYHVGGSSSVAIVPTTSLDVVNNSASGFVAPPPVTAPCTASGAPFASPSESPTPSCNPEDGEAQIDTEQVASLARDASVQFYLAYNPNDGCSGGTIGNPCPPGTGYPAQGLLEQDEELQTAIDHDSVDVLSLSYGGAEFSQVAPVGTTSPPYEFTTDGSGVGPTEFAMLAAMGIAVFASSGDQGAEACQAQMVTGHVDDTCVSYPASDPNVVGVGGVTLPLDAAGALVGPVTAWGVQTSGGLGGSGGGVSAYFTQPAYQQGLAGTLGSSRNVPDAALLGDPATGVSYLTYADPSFGARHIASVGGTSVAAPEMAAMWALVVQACKQSAACASKGTGAHPYRLGNPNPLLYGLGRVATTYAQTFLSVGYGDNAQARYCYDNPTDSTNCPGGRPGGGASPPTLDPGYTANPAGGYNQLTGLGVPFARALIKSVVGV